MASRNCFRSAAATHTGKVRDHNEDCFHADPDSGLFVVADGMGGMEAGEVASDIALRAVVAAAGQGHGLGESISLAHAAVRDAVDDGIGAEGMGTTVVAARFNGRDCEIAWVGDSRAYLWDEAGTLRRLTRDHSQVELLLASGLITEEQAHRHPAKNLITQCVGQREPEQLQVGELSIALTPGQSVLLCSDGLNDELTDLEIARCMLDGNSAPEQVSALIDATLEKGARDNVTVIVAGLSGRGKISGFIRNRHLVFALGGILLGALALSMLARLSGSF